MQPWGAVSRQPWGVTQQRDCSSDPQPSPRGTTELCRRSSARGRGLCPPSMESAQGAAQGRLQLPSREPSCSPGALRESGTPAGPLGGSGTPPAAGLWVAQHGQRKGHRAPSSAATLPFEAAGCLCPAALLPWRWLPQRTLPSCPATEQLSLSCFPHAALVLSSSAAHRGRSLRAAPHAQARSRQDSASC